MTETKSRINIDGPCPRCGKETFKGDCSDPWCHAAYMEADNERLERELQEAREVFVDLLDFVAGYRRAQMKMDQIIGETRTDSARLVSRDAAISDIQEQLQAAVLAAKGEKDG